MKLGQVVFSRPNPDDCSELNALSFIPEVSGRVRLATSMDISNNLAL